MVNKKRLSKNQQRRLHANHQAKQQWGAADPHKSDQATEKDDLFLAPVNGLVVSRYGQRADVESEDGVVYRCHLRRTLPSVVAGDRVIWRPSHHGKKTGIIEAVHDRDTEFVRPDYYDGVKAVAANVDQIIVVSAVMPEWSFTIIDRYLVACETLRIPAVLVINKMDMLSPSEKSALKKRLALYKDMGYPILFVSQKSGIGIKDLYRTLLNHTSVFVGQSGVGKSSLINALLPNRTHDARVGDVSENSGLGQHTTTAARWYHLPTGGALIDSPGVREFGLWHLEPADVARGFIDFHPYLGQCQYRDCRHGDDPGCAIREAVEQGHIPRSRFTHYHRIIDGMTKMKSKHHRSYKQGNTKK